MLLTKLSASHSIHMVGNTALELSRVSQYLCHPYWWGGSSHLDFVPSSNMFDSKSVVGIRPGDSFVITGYQVDEFTHTGK